MVVNYLKDTAIGLTFSAAPTELYELARVNKKNHSVTLSTKLLNS